ncbi:MAG: gliding motility-associated C-terminal domain-containing protein [Bacteroidetes bacterium]|nr:gliding motility-associated C-terminal domain-containing protein [Bacteroidota bacterium]
MRNFLFFLSCLCSVLHLSSQTDNCSAAPTLIVNATCSSPIAGTSLGATQSIAGCTGNADDDVWYKFVATATSHSFQVVGSAGYDAVVEFFSGTCSTLNSIACIDATNTGGTENGLISGLVVSNTYYIRIYHYGAGSGSSNFTTCLTNAPPAPANDACINATNIIVNAACVNTGGNSYGGTQSQAPCVGSSDDDVWFSFTATNYTQTIQVTPSTNMDAVMELFSGSCGGLTSISCTDNGLTAGIENVTAVGLTPGSTYYIRVYDYYSSGGFPFSICVSGNAAGPGQPNDDPCTAIQLPAVTSDCNYLQFSTVGATQTNTTLAPAPFSCAGGSSPFMGGFAAGTKDVWFKITVPANGNVYITPQPNLGAGFINDGVMVLYSGASCSALTQIACSDDYSAYPSTANDLLPYIAATGLTPGNTLYLRYFAYATSQGSFGICVQSPTNDNCSSALNICDINGYSGSTSAAYSADRPCNMFGNNETNAGVDQPNGINTGGPFGQGGPWGVGSPFFDVNINNNSWIKFVAASTSASFKINVGNCWVGNYPSGGLQMQIFSAAAACCSFVPVSDFKEGSSTFTINAVGLTVGNSYYLMIDGFAGDICNYTINALTGVSFANIAASTSSVCPGGTVILTGPAGASSYTWLPSGANTSTLSVTPGSTITYTLIAGGVCGFKQTLTKQIIVNPLPSVLINAGSPVTTCGTQTLTLTGSGASTYTWNTGPIASTISISPTVTTTYTLVGTSSAGCINSTVTTVTVNPLPTTSISASSNTICSGSSSTLSASGANTYTWSTGSSNTIITVSPASATVYTVTGTNSFGCLKTQTVNIGVNGLPTINSSSATICAGASGTLSASGGVSYVWSTSANTPSISVSPAVTTNYTVIGTAANSCTNSAIAQVSVNSLPAISVNSNTICSNTNATLTASGGNVYNWSTSASGPSIIVTPTVTTSYTVTGTATTGCTNTAVSNVTVLNIPQLTSTPTISPSNCSASTGSITSVVITGVPGLTYTWTNGASAVVGNAANLNTQPAGTYNLLVKDGQGCFNSFGPYSIINPGAPAAPTASAGVASLCSGGTINLFSSSSFSAPTTFNWSGPNTFSSTTQNPTIPGATSLMTGIYSVFATAAGCSGPATNVTVTVNNNPTPAASSSFSNYCAGNTILFFASTASTYTWSGPNGFSSSVQNPTITNAQSNASGLYQLQVSNAAGCNGNTTINITVNSNPALNAFATSTTVCSGNSINLNASGGNTYLWSGPNGFNSLQQNPTIVNSSTLSSGVYSITSTNTITGCNTSTSIAVVVNTLPVFNASATSGSVCTNSNIQLTANGSNITNYSWMGPLSYSATGPTQTLANATPANAGIYTITVIDINNCQSNLTVSVFVYSLSPVNANAGASTNTFCTGSSINLFGNTSALTYSWTGPNSFNSNNQNPVIINAQTNAAGIYTLFVTDINGCTNSDTAKVIMNQTPTLNSSSNGLTCAGQNVILLANFGVGAAVNWYSDLSLTSPLQVNSTTYSPTFGSFGTYTFYAQGIINGCTSSVTPITANYYSVIAGINSSTISGATPLSIQFTNTSTGINTSNSVSWTFGDGTGVNSYDASNVFTEPGTYTVTLIISNGLCSDTTQTVITVNVATIVIPEVFTPNGDTKNDVFDIKNIDFFPGNELQVFNRWGNVVYRMKGYNNTWDGSSNVNEKTGSGKLPTGTYFYLLTLGDNDKQIFRGFIQILY